MKSNEVLFIDDSLKNRESAKSVGWSAYHFEAFIEGVEMYKNKVCESRTEEGTAENLLH